MKYFLLLFLFVIELGSLSAQSFMGKLNPFPAVSESKIFADDTLRILAIMASFQQDADGTTFGNGKFGSIYTQNYGSDILDPLPHNQQYFESHLQFAKNYFLKVSKGKLEIEYTVLPDTFSVSDRMRNYSPSPGSDDFTPVADFSVEAWTKADQMYPDTNFSNYDIFLIFHAGVGRDVSLPGSIGNERDLPSVYLSDNAFKEIYGNDFEGIPVMGGSFYITNSMIIPETESRELESITGTFLFEITINGLICASIGSHLGLPDLFDTETGLSAIGRFGLMDGQSIFAYLGVFPPEPSPWEKIRLGWAEPVTMDIQNADVNLVTNLAATINDTVILKVPLNSSEYFLVENRIRDANDDGSMLSYITGDIVRTKTFLNDTTGYRSFDIDSLSGVIIDVDEFDWSVPGEGIVIWHIDENVINERISDNKINTDKNRRGVDVEEADGVQDIGERFFDIFGNEVIGEGTEEDFWHTNNSADLYENRFAKDTRPNTLTNTGANSLITLKNFSEISNRMSFRVEFGDSVVKPVFSNFFNFSPPIQGLSKAGDFFNFDVTASDSLMIIYNDTILYSLSNFSSAKTAYSSRFPETIRFGKTDSLLNYYLELSSRPPYTERGSVNIGEIITSNLALSSQDSVNEPNIHVGTSKGKIITFSLQSFVPPSAPTPIDSIEIGGEQSVTKIAADKNFIAAISKFNLGSAQQNNLFYSSDGTLQLDGSDIPIDLAVTKDKSGKHLSIILTSNKKFIIINSSAIISQCNVNGIDSVLSFSLADLEQDGTNYIVVNNGTNVEVYNLTGAMADNFPFTDPEGIGFVGTPLTADFEGDSKSEIISVTKDGRIFAIDGGTGKVVPGFPISCGGSVSITPVLYNASGKTNLAVLNDQNVLSAWSISSVEGKLYWSEEYGNPQNTSFIDAAQNTNRINEFFPSGRAYNYPNPVYEGTTNIRYYVSEDSKINIKIFDLAGDFVAELNDDAQGGMDNETVWNVGDIQSGVYLARIEANSTSRKTEQAIIKIAVVK
jgi:M6 family metalloprotease-like protein